MSAAATNEYVSISRPAIGWQRAPSAAKSLTSPPPMAPRQYMKPGTAEHKRRPPSDRPPSLIALRQPSPSFQPKKAWATTAIAAAPSVSQLGICPDRLSVQAAIAATAAPTIAKYIIPWASRAKRLDRIVGFTRRRPSPRDISLSDCALAALNAADRRALALNLRAHGVTEDFEPGHGQKGYDSDQNDVHDHVGAAGVFDERVPSNELHDLL